MPRLKVGAQGYELPSAVVRGVSRAAARFEALVYTLNRLLANRKNCRVSANVKNPRLYVPILLEGIGNSHIPAGVRIF